MCCSTEPSDRLPTHSATLVWNPSLFSQGLLDGSEKIGMLERSSSAWHPYLWPVKVVMIIGITLMLLQCISEFLKDILRLKGELV